VRLTLLQEVREEGASGKNQPEALLKRPVSQQIRLRPSFEADASAAG